MIPEEYYKAIHLRQRVQKPCLAGTTPEYCVDYKYLTVASTGAVNIPTKLGQFTGPRALLPYAPSKSFLTLGVQVSFNF